MSDPDKAVFLSYASQDKEMAKRICDALRAAGVEVWFDQSELRGGDAWDALIRKRIKECALFIPVITPSTNARAEGYFRLEWKLAVDRSHLMADDAPFLLPIVVGDVTDATARVPDKFREVQWTRLRLDETPAELGDRVARLLSSHGGASLDDARGRRQAAPLRKSTSWQWWMIFPIVGSIIGLLFAALPVWRAINGSPRKTVRSDPPAVQPVANAESPVAKPASAAPLSEARQLAERARTMAIQKYSSTADDYAVAEGLLKHALELEQNDAEIWAISSLFNTSIRTRGFDQSGVRREQARRDAERALKLSPDSVSGLYALGRTQRDTDPAAAEVTFKRMLALDPNDTSAMSQLAWIYDIGGRPDEAIALYDRALALTTDPGRAALSRYTQFLLFFHYGRFAEAEDSVRRSLALEPAANAQAGMAMLQLTWKGDAEAAAKELSSGPAATRNDTRIIWISAFTHLARRAPEDALKVLDRLQADFIQDSWFVGPKGYFTGRAHAMAGRPEAARLAWEAGLAVVDSHLKATPESRDLHLVRGQLLAWLGQTDEALREAQAVKEISRNAPGYWQSSPALIYAALGRADDAMPLIEKLATPDPRVNMGWPLTPALLRIDPTWDRIRNDVRFQRLLIEHTPPRDWPKDPELKRARKLIDSQEAISSDVALAEDIIKPVLAARPTDAEATVLMGAVQAYYLVRGFDRSEDRFAQAKYYAERGLALAPGDPEAQAVMAIYLYRRGVELPRAAKLLRQAIAASPQEARYYRMLDNVLSITPNISDAEIIASAKATAALFPEDALVQYELARHYRDAGMLDEAEHYLDLAIKLGPVANAIIARARLRLMVHGDPGGMKTLLDTLPERYRGTDRAVFSQFSYAMATRQPQLGLDALQALPEPWMIDFDYTGPTALLAGELLLQQGKAELARLRFAEALLELGRHKPDFQRNFSTTWLETWLLMRLNRLEEARQRNNVFYPELTRPYRLFLGTNWWFNPINHNLLLGERAKALELMRESVGFQQGRNIISNALRIDPRMAPFRDDPEIKAILAEPETKKL